MGTSERYLSAADAAKALGVSTRALRLYEQKGLIRPLRTKAGWRAYDTQALMRLHQILALKHMGLELSTIAQLLEGSLSSLDSVLALQERNLTARQTETHRALDLVRRARSLLSSGEALSVDDLTTLTRETTMDAQKMRELRDAAYKAMEPFYRKHGITPEDIKRLKSNSVQAGWSEALNEALERLEEAMKTGDVNSPEALEVARRFRVSNMRYVGGDLDLAARMRRAEEEASKDPVWAAQRVAGLAKFGFTPEHFAFVQMAMNALEAREAAHNPD